MSTETSHPPSIIFTEEQLRSVGPDVPKHIAIIPDGNRRWAKREGLGPVKGHWKGADILLDIVKGARDIGVDVVTVYGFSTENWSRPKHEVLGLLHVLETYLREQRQPMIDNGVRLTSIGDVSRFPESMQEALKETAAATDHCKRINFVLALNYGGRDDMRRAICQLVEKGSRHELKPEDVTEELISQHLDTAPWPDPDLLIRTSGEMRISNYLLWQMSYSEIYVTDLLWPTFTPQDLLEAVRCYQERHRRLGGS